MISRDSYLLPAVFRVRRRMNICKVFGHKFWSKNEFGKFKTFWCDRCGVKKQSKGSDLAFKAKSE